MAEKDYILNLHHKGQFTKTTYIGGTVHEVPEYIDSDKFSYSVVMEYVKDDLKYNEIGGIYVRKPAGGWKLIANDGDLIEFVTTVEGEEIHLYVDIVVDNSITPMSQMQPHVIVRPRTSFFEGLVAKRNFVTIEGLKKQRGNTKKPRSEKSTFQPAYTAQELCEYEKKRMDLILENKKKVDQLGLKTLADGLNLKVVKAKVQDDDEHDSDKEYVPDEQENEEIMEKEVAKKKQMKTKKQKVVTNPIRRPRTRSVITASNQMESTAQSSPVAENLPPPPPLTENLPPPPFLPENLPPPLPLPGKFPPPPPLREEIQPPIPSKKKPVKKSSKRGVGTMEDYVLLRKQEKIQEEEKNKMVNDGADQPVQTESQDEPLERKKGRGPTLMNNVYTRRPDEKKIIKLNCELQAIADDDKILSEFKNFLGTLSRQSVPLDCINWRRFPEKRKDELWSFVKTKYDIPEEGRTYTLRTIGSLWRLHKARIKKDHYFKYDNDDDRLKNKPEVIPVEEFKVLLNYWADEEVQRRSRENAENRQKIVETHTAGRISFAQIGEKIKTEKKIPPEQLAPKGEIYEITHKRDPKRKYKTNPDAEDENGEPVKKPSHGPNWLLGRSGKCRKTNKAQEEKLLTTSTANVDELRKTITKEVMAEMDRKMCEKMKRVMAKLGDINPDFKNLDVEELWAGDASEDDEEDNGEDDNNSEEDDIGEEGHGDEDDNN